jgi:hypothetical protein
MLLAFVSASTGCSEERKSRTPVLALEPTAFVFPKAQRESDPLERRVEIINRGSADLLIRNISLDDRSTNNEFSLLFEDADGNVGPVPDLIRIAPDATPRPAFRVTYSPSDDLPGADEGFVRLESNDPSALSKAIPITAGGQGAELRVSPEPIVFEQVEAGGRDTILVNVRNIGLTDLVISNLRIDGSADFTAALDDRALTGDLGENPIVLAPDAAVELALTYAPPALGRDFAELVILSNDARVAEKRVPIQARGLAPCINVLPDPVDFGSALLVASADDETPNLRTLTIESCGDVELRIDRFEFEGDAFAMVSQPERPDGPDGPALRLPASQGTPHPQALVTIGFWPTQEQIYGGRLLLYTSIQVEPIAVDLFGRGVENSCPVPDSTVTEYNVQPLDVIDLDGTPSTDPGGSVERWEWTVVSRPDGSVSQIVERYDDRRAPADGGTEDDPTTPEAHFFVDLAGAYELELRVYDNLGQISCDPKAVQRVVVEAVPDKDLHVQLVWSTPDDPDETDGFGTDLDLHLRHQRAGESWGEAATEWDCFFRNKTPDWGQVGDFGDDPSLDIDDTNGAGPENINLSNPEDGVSYDIAAIYFRAESTFGQPDVPPRTEHPSYATVRVYVRGEVVFELIDRELTRGSQLWHAARVQWCEDQATCPVVEEVDRVLEADEWFRP